MNTCWPLRTSLHTPFTLFCLYTTLWIFDNRTLNYGWTRPTQKNPWQDMTELVKTYITIQKSSKTVKIWPSGWVVKMIHFHHFNFGHLWQLITSATGVQRGSTFGSIKGLHLLDEWLKHRICSSRLSPFAAQLKFQKTGNFNKVLWGNG